MDKTLKVGDKALLSKAFTEEEVFRCMFSFTWQYGLRHIKR